MTTATLTLTDFLLARIAEDEERSEWQHRLLCMRTACDADGCLWDDEEQMAQERVCTCGYPARVLAECEAKRQIVGLLGGLGEAPEVHADAWTAMKWAIRRLAAVYSDHPDYRPEWRP